MDMFTQAIISNKIDKILRGEELSIKGYRVVLGETEDGKFVLAMIAQNETKNSQVLLPFDISFSELVNILAGKG